MRLLRLILAGACLPLCVLISGCVYPYDVEVINDTDSALFANLYHFDVRQDASRGLFVPARSTEIVEGVIFRPSLRVRDMTGTTVAFDKLERDKKIALAQPLSVVEAPGIGDFQAPGYYGRSTTVCGEGQRSKVEAPFVVVDLANLSSAPLIIEVVGLRRDLTAEGVIEVQLLLAGQSGRLKERVYDEVVVMAFDERGELVHARRISADALTSPVAIHDSDLIEPEQAALSPTFRRCNPPLEAVPLGIFGLGMGLGCVIALFITARHFYSFYFGRKRDA